jgi:hypothetical protein
MQYLDEQIAEGEVFEVVYFYCPIAMKLMENAMIAEGGVSFDSLSIEKSSNAVPNRQLQMAI